MSNLYHNRDIDNSTTFFNSTGPSYLHYGADQALQAKKILSESERNRVQKESETIKMQKRKSERHVYKLQHNL